MKLVSNLELCKGFAVCRGHITANDTYIYSIDDASTDTKFSQIFYMLEGSGTAYNEDGSVYGSSNNPGVWDLRSMHQKSYKFTAGEHGATWLCINPIPANNFFNLEILKQGSSKTIQGDGKEHIVMCGKGVITANDVELKQFKYTRVLNGKTINFNIPDGSEAIYLTR